ncbi:MAG: hypothetical protein O2854_06360 [Chloroflexi bacterium]|nr:hypothetical protein [Chloroflexota bacterium]
MNTLFRIIDFIKGPAIFQFFWHLLTSVSKLTQAEIDTVSTVLGPNAINFSRARIAQGRILALAFKINRNRAFTLFHTVNLPTAGSHTRTNFGLLVHEFTHVLQFETVGSVYIPQALSAQRSPEGYDYGGPAQLAQDWANGKRLPDYNREQQAQIANDYYDTVIVPGNTSDPTTRDAYQPLIAQLQNREL